MLENEKFENVYDNLLSRIEYLEYIVDNGYDIYIENKKWNQIDKNRLLIIAAEVNNLNLVKYFVDEGAKLNAVTDPEIRELYPEIATSEDMKKKLGKYMGSGYLALEIAAERGNLSVVKYLLGVDGRGLTLAIYTAIDGGHLETIKYLHGLVKDPTWNIDHIIITAALARGYIDIVDYYMNKGADMPVEWLFSAG